MARYRFLRDRAANGTAKNTNPAPVGQIAPINLYLTKQFKKGDVVEGVVSGNSITIEVNDAKQTSGQSYSGKVNLTTTIWDDRGGVRTYWMEELDSKNNVIKNKNNNSIFTIKNILIALLIAGVIMFVYKYILKK
jgi:hypothetical protein